MLKLFFDLKYQNITLTNPGVTVASDSKNYLVAKFNTISDDWEIPLSAVFVSTVDKVAYTVLVGQSASLATDECFVPWEVLRDSGEVYVSVFSGNLHTTNTAKFAVVKSGYVEGEIPPPPTPTVYEQILEELENKQDVIHLDNAVDEVYNPYGHYVLYYFDTQEIRHNIFDFEVFQELAEEKIYEILDSTLQGDPNIAPSLYVAANQSGSYSLVYMDSDDQEHVIFDFSNLPSGSSDYEDLENKPQINGITLSGNKRNSDLGFSNFYYSESNPPIYTSSAVDYQLNDIWINIITNTAFRLGFKDTNNLIWYPLRVKVFLDGGTPPEYENENVASLIYNAGDLWIDRSSTSGVRPRYHSNGIYMCLGSQRQSTPPYNRYNISWVRLDTHIIGATVNDNGTITFTNSDGTIFTTTGTSVIGFSPTATVTQTQSGATVSITDKNGTTTANISNGNDYVLTAQDKSDIADIVLGELPNADVMSF